MKLLKSLILACLLSGAALAQEFPTKPIRIVVPFPPGGTTDIVARLIAEPLGRELGQTVIVDNKSGAGGAIGAIELARAAPDGYTLGIATVSTMAVNPACNPKVGYDPLKDFVAISNIAATPNAVLVNAKFPPQDIKSLIALAKAEPNKYGYATSGNCGIGHMMGELFEVATGAPLVHVPYRGAGPALSDVVGGQVPIMMDNLPSSLPHIQGGRLRALAVAWPVRLTLLPNVPTLAELGYKDVNDPVWYGLIAPAKLPKSVADKIYAALVKVLKNKEVIEKIQKTGSEVIGNTSNEFSIQIQKEYQKMQNLVRVKGIKLEL